MFWNLTALQGFQTSYALPIFQFWNLMVLQGAQTPADAYTILPSFWNLTVLQVSQTTFYLSIMCNFVLEPFGFTGVQIAAMYSSHQAFLSIVVLQGRQIHAKCRRYLLLMKHFRFKVTLSYTHRNQSCL